MFKNFQLDNIFFGKLPHGFDLLKGLTDICIKNRIFMGKIEGIGAVKRATVGFYDQKDKVYHTIKINKPLEVLSLIGNISLKDDKPFVHAHITLADQDGRVYGGHLDYNTLVFAFEYTLISFKKEPLKREFDEVTGLYLWNL